MKAILLALIFSLRPTLAIASSSHQCEFTGKIEKLESGSVNYVSAKILFSSRTLRIWMFGRGICKDAVGKTFSISVPADDEFIKELSFGSPKEIVVFRICPDEAPGCFWDWHSYELTEQ